MKMIIHILKKGKFKCNLITVVLIALLNIPSISSADDEDIGFGDPPFLPGPVDDRVEFGEYLGEVIGQAIQMDEEIKDPIVIAYINYEKQLPKPIIGPFQTGNNVELGAELNYVEVNASYYWALNITKKQDYETPSMRNYKFSILVGDDEKVVNLIINNIIDNAPVIVPNQSSCKYEEYHIGNTECTYLIKDLDGYIDTFEYKLEGKTADNFYFEIEEINGTTYETNLRLTVQKELDFEKLAIHLFNIIAINQVNMNTSSLAIIEVINIPMRPPKWTSIFATKTFDEKTEQKFQVSAIDGDIQINTEINYRIIPAIDTEDFFHVDKKTGLITIEPIDRDKLQKEIFSFTVYAYKTNNESFFTDQEIVIIVNDINDHPPVVEIETPTIIIQEEKYVNFTDPVIIIQDIDLGINAQYNVELRDADNGKTGWYEAFTLVPNQGYQKSEFRLTINNATKLDYELPDWQNITLEVVAIGVENTTHIGVGLINIKLININDELPIFEQGGKFKTTKKESIPKGSTITTVKASDRDIQDSLIFSLSESSSRSFIIDEKTGVITTKLDKSLDHEVETKVTIYVYASDTFLDNIYNETHTIQAEVTIDVIDVNDKTPTITTNSKNVNIKEDVPEGTKLDIEIEGFDPDTSAKLNFTIEWDQSWATKQGRTVDTDIFSNCLTIKWKEVDDNHKAVATLEVQKPNSKDNETINYQKYEVIYLVVNVTDLKQEINEPSAIITIPITIIDINNRWPIFDTEITDQLKVVRDKASKDTLIGSVYATDDDGPEFNYVTYYIEPVKGTPDNLVRIDKTIGDIRVNGVISCDNPNYWPSLNYTVIATDCENRNGEKIKPCFREKHLINIRIDDVNDQKPTKKDFTEGDKVYIPEKSDTGLQFNRLLAKDDDRDEPYHTINYELDTIGHPDLQNVFDIDQNGNIFVHLSGNGILDRDFGQSKYTIFISMFDNYGGPGTQRGAAQFDLELIDINDQTPFFDEPSNFILPEISENSEEGDLISEIHASDFDDPQTNNTKVIYGIDGAWKIGDESNLDYSELFNVVTDDTHIYGSVYVAKELKNYFGDYILNLTVYDLGIDRTNRNASEFKLRITPYNYDDPVILFPKNGETLLLKQPKDVSESLMTYQNEYLDPFQADDNFNGTKWNMSFLIDNEDTFKLETVANTKAFLKLNQLPEKNNYSVILTVLDHGEPTSRTKQSKFTIYFIDAKSTPKFNEKKFKAEFHEGVKGTTEVDNKMPEAIDPIANLIGNKIRYFIIGGDKDHFELNSLTRELRVNKNNPLDYHKAPYHTLKIAATNEDHEPINPPPESVLDTTVKVLGVNLNPPHFNVSTFTFGITQKTEIGFLFHLDAYDIDVNDTLTFSMVPNSIKTHGSNLDKYKDDMFEVKSKGDVYLKREVQPEMSGYFTFDAIVSDAVKHEDTASIAIYVISDENQLTFKFENTVLDVQNNKFTIAGIFADAFETSECSVDKVSQDTDDDGKPYDNRTNVITHFLNDTVPVEAKIIRSKTEDIDMYYKLKEQFKEHKLNYLSAYDYNKQPAKDMERLLQAILSVICGVLALLCIILFVAFIVRTRSLNRRLALLSTTKFGSQESNLNRIGAPLPNTNQFAVDGSNPVWNEEMRNPDIDRNSIGSGDSELIGIEDNPAFSNNDLVTEITLDEPRRSSFNPVMQEQMKRRSLNPMANLDNSENA